MLLSAAPLLQTPWVNVLPATVTGWPWCCAVCDGAAAQVRAGSGRSGCR